MAEISVKPQAISSAVVPGTGFAYILRAFSQ
uniref:Uncharacterized protein n=1 Tax=Rhizophora mucronata TaxID=61149 RepID=A0A2P2IIN2_RHIMU